MNYDIAVIGGGPGGYTAALKAAQKGASVLLVEKAKLGGVCLQRGCIPTKTLLTSAEKWLHLQKLAEFGLSADNFTFDFAKIMARKTAVVAQLEKGIAQLIKQSGLTFVYGTAKLTGGHGFTVTTENGVEEHTATHIILATGSEPVRLPIPGGDLDGVLNSDGILEITEVPKSMVVIGGGALGLEFASVFSAFGCHTTVVEIMPQILPGTDIDVVRRLGMALRKQKITVMTDTKINDIRRDGSQLIVSVEKGSKASALPADIVLLSAGRRAVTAGLGLEEAGIDYTRKGITVNDHLETSAPGIYAIGDVTGRTMLAHAASAAAAIAVENACGGDQIMNYDAVPACVFTMPEAGMVGLSEQAAKEQGFSVKCLKYNFAANGKAVSLGQTDGMTKIVLDSTTGKILGMHIVGPHASDLIMEGAIAITNGLTVNDLQKTIHPHPTLSEAVFGCADSL